MTIKNPKTNLAISILSVCCLIAGGTLRHYRILNNFLNLSQKISEVGQAFIYSLVFLAIGIFVGKLIEFLVRIVIESRKKNEQEKIIITPNVAKKINDQFNKIESDFKFEEGEERNINELDHINFDSDSYLMIETDAKTAITNRSGAFKTRYYKQITLLDKIKTKLKIKDNLQDENLKDKNKWKVRYSQDKTNKGIIRTETVMIHDSYPETYFTCQVGNITGEIYHGLVYRKSDSGTYIRKYNSISSPNYYIIQYPTGCIFLFGPGEYTFPDSNKKMTSITIPHDTRLTDEQFKTITKKGGFRKAENYNDLKDFVQEIGGNKDTIRLLLEDNQSFERIKTAVDIPDIPDDELKDIGNWTVKYGINPENTAEDAGLTEIYRFNGSTDLDSAWLIRRGQGFVKYTGQIFNFDHGNKYISADGNTMIDEITNGRANPVRTLKTRTGVPHFSYEEEVGATVTSKPKPIVFLYALKELWPFSQRKACTS